MKRRLDLSQAAIVPWEIPDIAAPVQKVPRPVFFELELGQDEKTRELAVNAEAMKLNGAAVRHADEISVAEPDDPRASQGHAEGFEIGLQEGRERGYAEGFDAGRKAADLQFADHLRRLETVVQRLGEPMRSLERPVEEAVISLALEVARWVIGSEISGSRDYLVRLIRDAVAKVPIDVGTPMIVLNPADAELVRAAAPDLENNGIALILDDTMEPGGCRVIANGAEGIAVKDRRWHPRALQGICQVDLTLASRWRDAMFAMFEGEDT
jgi:flagellar biosynthesis/type III secretory pathway protein FliH